MSPSGLETLGLGSLGEFRRRSESGSVASIGSRPAPVTCLGIARAFTVGSAATIPALTGGSLTSRSRSAWSLTGRSLTGRPVSASALGSVTTILAISSITSLASISGRKLLCDRLEWLAARNEFEKARLRGLPLRIGHGNDRHAVELGLGIRSENRTDGRAGREKRPIEHTLGLARAGCSPRPGAIRARAGEFDVDPSGHSPPRYPRSPRFCTAALVSLRSSCACLRARRSSSINTSGRLRPPGCRDHR